MAMIETDADAKVIVPPILGRPCPADQEVVHQTADNTVRVSCPVCKDMRPMPHEGRLPTDDRGWLTAGVLRVVHAYQERLVTECQYIETMRHDGRP